MPSTPNGSRSHASGSHSLQMAMGMLLLALGGFSMPLHAQSTTWIITTATGDVDADPRELSIRADYLTVNDRKPPEDIAIADILEVNVFRHSTFWEGAKDGALIGAGIGAAGGLAAGALASSSSAAGNATRTILASTAAGGVVFGILGGMIGGLLRSLASDESHDFRGMSDPERRMELIALQQEAGRRN